MSLLGAKKNKQEDEENKRAKGSHLGGILSGALFRAIKNTSEGGLIDEGSMMGRNLPRARRREDRKRNGNGKIGKCSSNALGPWVCSGSCSGLNIKITQCLCGL